MFTMAAINQEVISFVTKFQSLMSAGCKASLTFKTENGNLSVSMNADFLLPLSHKCYEHSSFQCTPNGRRRGPAYYRRQLRRKSRATKSNDTRSTQSAENEVEDNTDDSTQASELKSIVQKDNSRSEISDVPKESTSIGAEEVHKVEDSKPSPDNQPSSCTTLFSTKTLES